MKQMRTTLLFLKKDDQILLAQKKRGFGAGKYNGVGGKLEKDETFLDAMIRECEEEISVTPLEYLEMGELRFHEYLKGEELEMVFRVYTATKWQGIPAESEEVIPKWFSVDEIPYDQMFSDDIYWLPFVLDGKRVNGYFAFDSNWNLIEHQVSIEEMPQLKKS